MVKELSDGITKPQVLRKLLDGAIFDNGVRALLLRFSKNQNSFFFTHIFIYLS